MKEIEETHEMQNGVRTPNNSIYIVQTTDGVRYIFEIDRTSILDEGVAVFSHRYFQSTERYGKTNHRLPQKVEEHIKDEFEELVYKDDFMIDGARLNEKLLEDSETVV